MSLGTVPQGADDRSKRCLSFMAVNLDDTFRRGGKALIDLLDYCVRSVQMDPVFVFLAREYQLEPTAAKAVALYDVFCAPEALARISPHAVLPPVDYRIQVAVAPLKKWILETQPLGPQPPECRLMPPLPAKFLFDFIVHHLEQNQPASLRKVSDEFDPTRTPIENLPGGRMNLGQRAFVENIWEPRLRPQLVGAGFRRIGNIA